MLNFKLLFVSLISLCCSSSSRSRSPEDPDRERPRVPVLEESGRAGERLRRESGESRRRLCFRQENSPEASLFL